MSLALILAATLARTAHPLVGHMWWAMSCFNRVRSRNCRDDLYLAMSMKWWNQYVRAVWVMNTFHSSFHQGCVIAERTYVSMSYSIATLRSWMNQDLLTCPIVSCLKATVFNELSCGIMIIVPYSLSIGIWISPLIGIDLIRRYTAVDTVLSKTKTKTKKPLFYLDNIFNNLLIFNTVLTKVLSDFIVLASILHDLTLTKSTQNIRVPQIDVRAYHPTETCVQKITQAPHRLNHLWIKSILCLVCCLRYCMSGCWLQNDSNFYHATNNVSSCQLTAAMPARRHHEWHWILWGKYP